jgi:hypothetical protein
MVEIKDLLGKFGDLLASSKDKKQAIKNAVFEATGIKLKEEEIQIKNGTVYLNVKPIYKNEVLLKRDKINSLLESYLGQKKPGDFR